MCGLIERPDIWTQAILSAVSGSGTASPSQIPAAGVLHRVVEPEYMDPLKDDSPERWYVTGYPWYLIKTPEHMTFLTAYQKRHGDHPRISSVVGYSTVKALA